MSPECQYAAKKNIIAACWHQPESSTGVPVLPTFLITYLLCKVRFVISDLNNLPANFLAGKLFFDLGFFQPMSRKQNFVFQYLRSCTVCNDLSFIHYDRSWKELLYQRHVVR